MLIFFEQFAQYIKDSCDEHIPISLVIHSQIFISDKIGLISITEIAVNINNITITN